MKEREKFSSRLGFVLISAGCAIGLGNIWRFPYIVGRYGGAAFVLLYLVFLVILGLPIMIMEFSVGRASGKSIAQSFHKLEPEGSKWHIYGWFGMFGNYMLMMFYTTVAGWMLQYMVRSATGDFVGLNADQVSAVFVEMLADPISMTIYMIATVAIALFICSKGVQNGVERVTKGMMLCLLGLLLVLAVRSITLPGASAGLEFYLIPSFRTMVDAGLFEAVYAALGQAFFTLSLGIGSMAIFGSYIGKDRSLTGEAINVTLLDTFVAIVAGLIIFPACFAFGINPESGPALIFITLPNVFNSMAGGQIWGTLFFVFMSFAALSTVIGVFENILSCCMDMFGWSRKKAVIINLFAIILLSMPCVLGFNVWADFAPFGAGSTIQDLEDFIISENLLPIGSMVYLLFCVSKRGWGYENFLQEANTGKGLKMPSGLRVYLTYILPLIVLFVFVMGYYNKFFG